MSLAKLAALLPLPEEELKQVLEYAATLSKAEARSHFGDLLGDYPDAEDFISSFNSNRAEPSAQSTSQTSSAKLPQATSIEASDAVPKSKRAPKKKKPDLHTPQARRVEDFAAASGTTYNKKDQDLEYIPQRQRLSAPTSNEASRSNTPKPQPVPARPSAGFLVSDSLEKSKKSKSNQSSRSSTPKPTTSGGSTKITVTGGTPMAGQSTAISDLDAAIRALEITTNPTLDNPSARKCNCVAMRHPLQGAAPNCLSCGKVICMKEGLGPCTFCGTPLLSPADVQAMMRELREERGRERMMADAKANRRADISKAPAPFTVARGDSTAADGGTLAEAEAKAREHRDKLLGFQAQNARRTTVRDEAADFDVSGAMSGTGSMWASPEERARELKRQQKVMRELEWNARPEYEKRQQVVSIDLVGGKVVRRMAAKERPPSPEDDDIGGGALLERSDNGVLAESTGNKGAGGAFSRNPLLGSLIKPVFEAKGKDVAMEPPRQRKTLWRRVQDDLDNNEGVILDGGVYGHSAAGDEPDCG
jgi:hypothetical protein